MFFVTLIYFFVLMFYAELDDATSKIQESTLKLLKLEKSFLKTASIVSDVINDLVDNDEEDTDIKPHFYLEEIIKDLNDNSDLTETVSNASDDADGAYGDPCSGITRLKRCDVVTRSNMSSIGKFKDKMSKVVFQIMAKMDDIIS